jgi:WD40-like Beta Propeller Repeat
MKQIVITGLALGLVLTGCATSADPEAVAPTSPATRPTTAAPSSQIDGPALYFPAQDTGGDALRDPVEFRQAEFKPRPTDIYLVHKGHPARRVIATAAREECPRVSPDGSHIAHSQGSSFVLRPLGDDGTPGAPAAGVRLPKDRTSGCSEWSPDGTRVGYVLQTGRATGGMDDPMRAEVRALAIDGTRSVLVRIDTRSWAGTPAFAWSPDGTEVAYTRASEVWRVALRNGSEPRLVWRAPPGDPGDYPVSWDRPVGLSWTVPNEIAITVHTETALPGGGATDGLEIHVVAAGSGRERKLWKITSPGQGVDLSADGSMLVEVTGKRTLRVTARIGGPARRVAVRLPGVRPSLITDVAWSPDGDGLLAMVWHRQQGYALVTLSVDGGAAELLTPWTWALDWTDLSGMSERVGGS